MASCLLPHFPQNILIIEMPAAVQCFIVFEIVVMSEIIIWQRRRVPRQFQWLRRISVKKGEHFTELVPLHFGVFNDGNSSNIFEVSAARNSYVAFSVQRTASSDLSPRRTT